MFRHIPAKQKVIILFRSYSLEESGFPAFISLGSRFYPSKRELAYLAEMNGKARLYVLDEYSYMRDTIGMNSQEYNQYVLDNSTVYRLGE